MNQNSRIIYVIFPFIKSWKKDPCTFLAIFQLHLSRDKNKGCAITWDSFTKIPSQSRMNGLFFLGFFEIISPLKAIKQSLRIHINDTKCEMYVHTYTHIYTCMRLYIYKHVPNRASKCFKILVRYTEHMDFWYGSTGRGYENWDLLFYSIDWIVECHDYKWHFMMRTRPLYFLPHKKSNYKKLKTTPNVPSIELRETNYLRIWTIVENDFPKL